MAAMGSAYFGGDQATAFVAELRAAKPTAVGDAISAALRAVAQAEQPITEQQGSRVLVALALLLSPFEPEVLDGAPDEAGLGSWFGDLEIELNPARTDRGRRARSAPAAGRQRVVRRSGCSRRSGAGSGGCPPASGRTRGFHRRRISRRPARMNSLIPATRVPIGGRSSAPRKLIRAEMAPRLEDWHSRG